MATPSEIGARVKRVIATDMPGTSQGQIARQVGMTPDALSRALNGGRSFSAIELAELADLLGADIHWLITGEPDPRRAVFAARHAYDFATGTRDVPGRAGDEAILQDIELAYRQAKSLASTPDLPGSPSAVAEALGPGFVRPLADRVEERLGVDVVRVAGLSTAYCFTMAGRSVIVVPAVGNWFRENWDIAHELGHLVAGHLNSEGATGEQETAANAFAAELLLPDAELQTTAWDTVTESGLARLVWDFGVSTDALARRLRLLGLMTPLIDRWSREPTQRLLRYHWQDPNAPDGDAITERMDAAAARRFPIALQRAHITRIAAGELPKDTLAWMLGVPPDTLEVDVPTDPAEADTDDLADALGFTPST